MVSVEGDGAWWAELVLREGLHMLLFGSVAPEPRGRLFPRRLRHAAALEAPDAMTLLSELSAADGPASLPLWTASSTSVWTASVGSQASRTTQSEASDEPSDDPRVSESAETASEQAEPELPPHLEFDEDQPAAVFVHPVTQANRTERLAFRNLTDGRLRLYTHWAALSRADTEDPENENMFSMEEQPAEHRRYQMEQLDVELSRQTLGPGEQAHLIITCRLEDDGYLAYGDPEAFKEPLVLELHSRAEEGAEGRTEQRSAEVEVLFVYPIYVDGYFSVLRRPFSPRIIRSLRVSQMGRAAWIRLSPEEDGDLFRCDQPGRLFFLSGDREEGPLQIPFRFKRAPALEEETQDQRRRRRRLRGVLVSLGEAVEAEDGTAQALAAARGREERERLIQERGTAAFARPRRDAPVSQFKASGETEEEMALEAWPSGDLRLAEAPDSAYLLLDNISNAALVWTATLRPSSADSRVALELAAGRLEPESRGHLGLSLIPDSAGASPTQSASEERGGEPVYLDVAFCYAPPPGDAEGQPEDLPAFVRRESAKPDHVAVLSRRLFFP